MPAEIKAEELPLTNIFADNYRFNIPEYQRPYAWTTEQTSELLDDVLYAMEQASSIDDSPPYFLGSIVIIKDPNSPPADIVDGQQRITTLTIMFCVLRELASRDHDSIDKYVCEISDRYAGIVGDYRLTVRTRDRDFFQGSIQQPGKLLNLLDGSAAMLSDSQKRMFYNAKWLREHLEKFDEPRRDELMTFLVRRCYMVVVSTTDQSSAYRIFSVMNTRGLDLSPTDILKAELIGALEDSIRGHYTDTWEDLEEDLGRDTFRDLFTHIRMIYAKDKARDALNEEFKKYVLAQFNGQTFIDNVLSPLADAFGIVIGANYISENGAGLDAQQAQKINRYLNHLGRLDNFDWVPAAIAYFDRYKNDAALLARFTKDLERLAYSMFIRRENINVRIRRYAEVLRAIEGEQGLFEEGSPLQLSDAEMAVTLSYLAGPIYQVTRARRTILLRLDGLVADAGATYDHSIVTIEHVLPQNPESGSEWLRWFPDEETRFDWTHRIANLVLLSRRKNTSAQNYEFERKKRKYFTEGGASSFALTSQVLGESEWTPVVLERRQRDLIGVLSAEWRLG